jgi:hypothetical protein
MWTYSPSRRSPGLTRPWKRDGKSQFYVGPTKTGAGKRTIGLNPALVELLIPLVASRPGRSLCALTAGAAHINVCVM